MVPTDEALRQERRVFAWDGRSYRRQTGSLSIQRSEKTVHHHSNPPNPFGLPSSYTRVGAVWGFGTVHIQWYHVGLPDESSSNTGSIQTVDTQSYVVELLKTSIVRYTQGLISPACQHLVLYTAKRRNAQWR